MLYNPGQTDLMYFRNVNVISVAKAHHSYIMQLRSHSCVHTFQGRGGSLINNIFTDNETSVLSENATHAASSESEFPEDLFTEEQRRRGAILLHVILALYCFAAIATVCTEYFLPTIRCICQGKPLGSGRLYLPLG